MAVLLRLALLLGVLAGVRAYAAADAPVASSFAPVVPNRQFQFPQDHGAHPAFRNEWWYITGWLEAAGGRELGFQVTFFRSRPTAGAVDNPSAFAPKEIIFAHAALSDPSQGKLLHDERAARAGFGLAQAATGDTDVVLDRWTLKRDTQGGFHARVPAKEFALELDFAPTQPVLLEGEDGFSRKGPKLSEASYYYSMPHLNVSGSIEDAGKRESVHGTAWLDREWSSSYLDENAVGWDWVGLNLDDGGAVMAFQIRDAKGGALWGGATLRRADGTSLHLDPADVRFSAGRVWTSPHTGARYPVEQSLSLRLPEGERRFSLQPLMDDQELDTSAQGSPVYWEGAVKAEGARGYLELTGYYRPLKL